MDISENLLLQRSICQTLLNSELDAFIVADGDSRIVFWNTAAEIMFGHPREHAIGQYLHELIAPEDIQERAKDAFAHFRATGSGSFINNVVEMDALHKSGNLFPVEISLSATPVEGEWFAQAIVRSIGRRKENEAEMQRLITTDALTGIFNRKSMFEHGNREISRALRYGHHLSLVLFDIDQLKEINEKSGHYAGDQVIQVLAEFIKKNCRYSDIAGRLSGEELLILLPETDVRMAAVVAEKWRVEIRALEIEISEDESLNFNCSIGVSSLENEDRFDVVLDKAEANLQEAKALGGNTVVCRGQN